MYTGAKPKELELSKLTPAQFSLFHIRSLSKLSHSFQNHCMCPNDPLPTGAQASEHRLHAMFPCLSSPRMLRYPANKGRSFKTADSQWSN